MIYSINSGSIKNCSNLYLNSKNIEFGRLSSSRIKQKSASKRSNSNNMFWLLGIISAATIIAAAIAGRKGYLGKTIQKFLGGLKKAETAPKPTERQGEKLPDKVDNTTEIPKTSKKKKVPKKIDSDVPQIKSKVELPDDIKGAVEFILKINKKVNEFSTTIDELVPSRMVICSDMSVEGISRLPHYHGASPHKRIAVRYPSWEPKYLVELLNNDSKKHIIVEERDRKTGKKISQFSKPEFIYSVFHPRNTSKKVLSVYFHEDCKTRKILTLRKYDYFGNEIQYEARAYFNPDGTLDMINSDKYGKYNTYSVNMYYNKDGAPATCYIDKFIRKHKVSILTKLKFDNQGTIIRMSRTRTLPPRKPVPSK